MKNENQNLNRGFVRSDGLILWTKFKKTGFEYWVTKERYEELKKQKNSYLKKWRDRNRIKTREQAKGYRLKFLEKARLRNRIWAQKDREKNPKKNRIWKQANKARCVYLEEKRRARKKSQIPDDCWNQVVSGFYQISDRLTKCLGIRHAVDHIFPLSKGGSHCHRNLQVLPFSWNSKKLARLDAELPNCYRTDGFWYVKK